MGKQTEYSKQYQDYLYNQLIEALDAVEGMVKKHCENEDRRLLHLNEPSNIAAIDLLEKHGRVMFASDYRDSRRFAMLCLPGDGLQRRSDMPVIIMDTLTTGEAFVLKWQTRRLSGFFESLAKVIEAADETNLERLRQAFPEEVEAVQRFWTQTGWWRNLQEKVGLDPDL